MSRSGLTLLAAGGLAALAVPGAMPAPAAGAAPPSPGERAFQKCYACHALGDADEGAQGPPLKGILERPVASWPGYAYSPALRAYAERQPRWTRAALDAFLADPEAVVPNSAMGFMGLRNPAERAALIAFLAER